MSAKTLCLEHGEKVLFGASVLVLAAYVLFGWVLRGEDPIVAAVREDLRRAATRLACDDAPPLAALDDPAVAREWARTADAGPTWSWHVPYRVPKVVARVIDPGVRPPKLVQKPPVLDPPTAEVGRVDLAWSLEEGSTAPLKGWVVFRRAAGGEWTGFGPLPAEARAYSDSKVEPEASYEYRVDATPDPAVVFEDKGCSSEVRSVRTPEGTLLRLVRGSKDMATIQVERYLDGSWKSQPFHVRPGAAIGQDLWNPIGGTLLPMATGCVLLTIEEVTRMRKEMRTGKRLVPDPDQPSRQLLVPYEYEAQVPERLLRATYRDRSGQVRELWQETGRP